MLKLNSSSIALLTVNFVVVVLYWAYTDPYCFVYWAIQENIALVARPIRKIIFFNISLPGS